jgi:hypothetical protein
MKGRCDFRWKDHEEVLKYLCIFETMMSYEPKWYIVQYEDEEEQETIHEEFKL